MGVEKRCVGRGEKISFSEGGGGINTVFGPKYKPLVGHKDYGTFGQGNSITAECWTKGRKNFGLGNSRFFNMKSSDCWAKRAE